MEIQFPGWNLSLMKSKERPLLSICIPTYNRVGFLRILLQALLPQLEEYDGKVELVISDNGSDDGTENLVRDISSIDHLIYHRYEKNIGVIANIIQCPLQLASGEFIWMMSDHNLLVPEGLKYLISLIEDQKQHYKIFNLNFYAENYHDSWPERATGGYINEQILPVNEDMEDHPVEQWYELLNSKTSLGTQLYAHIVRGDVWTNFWHEKRIPKHFGSAQGTYPHSYMIANTLFLAPAFYIGKPLITIFNGAQTWNDRRQTLNVLLIGFTDLIDIYNKKGLSKTLINESKDWLTRQSKPILKAFLADLDRGHFSAVLKYFFKNIRRPYIFKIIWASYFIPEYCFVAKSINYLERIIIKIRKTIFSHS